MPNSPTLEIKWAKRAKKEFSKRINYLLSTNENNYVLIFANRIDNAILRITKENAQAHPRCKELMTSDKEYRYILVDKHKIIFYLRANTLYIVSLFSCARNPQRLLGIIN